MKKVIDLYPKKQENFLPPSVLEIVQKQEYATVLLHEVYNVAGNYLRMSAPNLYHEIESTLRGMKQ